VSVPISLPFQRVLSSPVMPVTIVNDDHVDRMVKIPVVPELALGTSDQSLGRSIKRLMQTKMPTDG